MKIEIDDDLIAKKVTEVIEKQIKEQADRLFYEQIETAAMGIAHSEAGKFRPEIASAVEIAVSEFFADKDELRKIVGRVIFDISRTVCKEIATSSGYGFESDETLGLAIGRMKDSIERWETALEERADQND